MATPETKTRIQPKLNIKEPSRYKVIYVNDEVTTFEFVVRSLITVFGYDYDGASGITHTIHEAGSAVVAVLPYEIAEQKGVEVTLLAREEGFPLAVKIEADN
jgi:ATP-dependent Clp protease adaptor protein ClpS